MVSMRWYWWWQAIWVTRRPFVSSSQSGICIRFETRIASDRLTNKQRIPIKGFVKAAEPHCYESGFFDFVTIIQLFHCESHFGPFAVTVLIYALNISCGGAAGSAGRWQIPSSWHLSCRFFFCIHCSRNHMQAITRFEDDRFNRLLRFFRWCHQYQRNATRITPHVYSTLFISESNTVREPVIIQSMMYSWMDCINSTWLEFPFLLRDGSIRPYDDRRKMSFLEQARRNSALWSNRLIIRKTFIDIRKIVVCSTIKNMFRLEYFFSEFKDGMTSPSAAWNERPVCRISSTFWNRSSTILSQAICFMSSEMNTSFVIEVKRLDRPSVESPQLLLYGLILRKPSSPLMLKFKVNSLKKIVSFTICYGVATKRRYATLGPSWSNGRSHPIRTKFVRNRRKKTQKSREKTQKSMNCDARSIKPYAEPCERSLKNVLCIRFHFFNPS